ncbi:hypothetical protein KOW79_007320 [Hemibagrus wyckioides]|uniref:Uncharacterized protein n=1 Tax=Hemibagrus wyckioides TaxID=337641 RepID=A0A9D3NV80_9TELE|nr:hypothetical protein KOW79_007320 [Hemibagrus wyckioides]
MNVKILTLVIVLLLSLLCSARAGPVTSTEHSKELEEVGSMRTPIKAPLRAPTPLVLISMLFLCLREGPVTRGLSSPA